MPSADLFLRVAEFGNDPLRLLVQVQNNVTDPDGLRIDATIDGTAGAMATPTTLSPQKVEMRVYVANVLVPELHSVRVTRSRNNNLQTWEFSVPIHRTATGYAGAWVGGGTGLCKQAVSIYGVYKTSTGTHEIPLIVNGIADSEGRESQGGAIITYSGVDAGGRYDGEMIDLILPPGSGLTRDRVVKVAASRAGVPNISLETSDTEMNKEFQMADSQFLPPCQELADVEGRVLQWDRSASLVWPQYGSGALAGSDSRWSLTEKNWVMGSGKLTQPGDIITEVTVDGEEQVLVGTCGDLTSTVRITTTSLNGPIAPAWHQAASSVYTANPAPTAPTEPITVRVEVFETTKRCGILVYEKRSAYEFYNPETSRYEWDAATDAWITLADVYTDDNTDDDSPAFSLIQDKWTLTEVDETWHYWMRGGFRGPTTDAAFFTVAGSRSMLTDWGLSAPIGWDGETDYDPDSIQQDDGSGYISAGFEGCKIGTLRSSQRFYAPRQYVATRANYPYPRPFWEETEPANGWNVLGNKESIVGDVESLIQHSREVTQYGTDGRGFLTDEVVHRAEWWAPPGENAVTGYMYGDGIERTQAAETFQYVGATWTRYVGAGEQSHDEIVTDSDYQGGVTGSVLTSGLDSYLPAIERIPDSGPPADSDIYEDDDELAGNYNRAYRTESKPISVTLTDDDLEGCVPRSVPKVQSAYIENEDEADWLARWLIDESMASMFDGTLAGANFFIEPGDWCDTVRYPQIGVDGAGRVEEVSWEWKPGAPINTDVSIRLYEVNA